VGIVRKLRAAFVNVHAYDVALLMKVLTEQLYGASFLHTNLKMNASECKI
jgi:hypothetical protein